MTNSLRTGLVISLVTTVLMLIAIEAVLRLAIRPSHVSYGTLFGIELPPVKVIWDKTPPPTDRDQPFDHLVVDGRAITVGDLWGIFREDPLLGYAPRENARSVNDWWQSNNLGARDRREITRGRPFDRKRLLVFGNSMANSSRIRQDDMWSAQLEKLSKLQVVNFGVDGYSMGQAFIRYTLVKDSLEHDVDLLMFPPSADLGRDISPIRSLRSPGQGTPLVLPRFVLQGDTLRLIKPLYPDRASLYAENFPVLSQNLRAYLAE